MKGSRRCALLLPLALAACGRPGPPRDRDHAADESREASAEVANEAAADDQLLTSTRVDALQNQVDQLQAEVADKTGGNAQLETELLEQRVEALEKRVYADQPAAAPTPSSVPAPTPAPDTAKPARSPVARPRPAAASSTPRPRPRLDLDLSDHP